MKAGVRQTVTEVASWEPSPHLRPAGNSTPTPTPNYQTPDPQGRYWLQLSRERVGRERTGAMRERAIERSGEREGEAPQALAWEWVYAGRANGQLTRRSSVERASVTIVAFRYDVQKTTPADKLGVNLTRYESRGRYTGQG